MSKVPMGKVLLRNVIRHTDAHNKIQEESEMWKMRQKEVSHHKLSSAAEFTRGQMHCDRVPNDSRDQSRSHERTSGHDEREARYWTRRLYEFEASDPDRWGHSGFKELYPEEFENDGGEESGNKSNGHHKKKKSKSSLEAAVSKRSKKSSRKKKKKRKKKEEKRKGADGSSSDGSSDESDTTRPKHKRKRTKSKRKSKKSERNRGREEDTSSEESDEGDREKWTNSHKKRKLDFRQGSDSGLDSQKKRRKNWKVVNDDKSDETSAD